MASPDAPNPYRDELQAAQSRVALLEEKLAAQKGDDEPEDEELTRLRAQRRDFVRSSTQRVAGERSMTAGLVIVALASFGIRIMTASMAHPNLGRAAITAIACGVCAAAVVFFGGISGSRQGILAVDAKIAAVERRLEEARRLRSIERELRAARKARGEDASPPRARIAVDAEPDEELEADEAVKPRRASR